MAIPYSRAWSGETDANGNLTVTVIPSSTWATLLTVSGQAKGTPFWAVYRNYGFLLPGAGPMVALGPIYCAPNEQLQIVITGATPGTPVTGTIWGLQSTTSDGSDLPLTAALSNSTVTEVSGGTIDIAAGTVDIGTVQGNVPVVNAAGTQLTTQQPTKLLGTVTAPAGTNAVEKTLTLDPGALAIGILASYTGGNGNPTGYRIDGISTGQTYLDVNTSSPGFNDGGGLYVVRVPQAADAQVKVTLSPSPNQQTQILVLEFFDPVLVSVFQNPTDPIHVDLSALENEQIGGSNVFGTQLLEAIRSAIQGPFGPTYDLGVSLAHAAPAPWQAPTTSMAVHQAFAANTDYTMIAGVAGKRIYVHTINLVWEATSQWELVFYDGPSSGNIVIGELSLFTVAPPPIDFKVRPLSVGNGLVFRSNGNVNARGTITWSQQ